MLKVTLVDGILWITPEVLDFHNKVCLNFKTTFLKKILMITVLIGF